MRRKWRLTYSAYALLSSCAPADGNDRTTVYSKRQIGPRSSSKQTSRIYTYMHLLRPTTDACSTSVINIITFIIIRQSQHSYFDFPYFLAKNLSRFFMMLLGTLAGLALSITSACSLTVPQAHRETLEEAGE